MLPEEEKESAPSPDTQEETDTTVQKDTEQENMEEGKQTINYPGISEKRGPSFFNKKILFAVLVLLLVAGLLGGGIYFYQSQIKKASEPITAPPPSSVVVAPTPTPQTVDLSAYSVQILNGSGIIGEAGKVKTLLEEQGFKEFTTGNAKSFEFTNTEVSMKVNIEEAAFDKIKQALGENYTVIKADPLEDNSKYNIVITIGKKASETSKSE